MKRFFELLWLRIREYFKHPAEDIRQAKPIVPGRLYSNFGYVCKAVRLSADEMRYIAEMKELNANALPACLFYDRPIGDTDRLRQLHEVVQETTEAPVRCEFCHLYHHAIPCPFYNTLADGTVVCDTHKYVILKNQR